MSRRIASLLPLVACLFALPATGCASLVGNNDTDADFKVLPNADGSFSGWTEITVDSDVNQAKSGTLTAVNISVEKPETYPDLTFMQDLLGEAVTPTGRTTLITGSRFVKGEKSSPMKVMYHGDLRPFFPDGHTIRIEWSGHMQPGLAVPADGFWVKAIIKVDIE
jgi:hypothetical protein